ncbi:MAG: hypothetical protein CMJ76_13240 [Planctomycetaceae bacterium]|nr:hypothetical protein [Planctomycetaceae bacterium]
MFDIFTTPIIGTPQVPTLKLGMMLSVMTLVPGLSEVLIGAFVAGWLFYLAIKISILCLQQIDPPRINTFDAGC